MKVLIVDETIDALGVALKMQSQGDDVLYMPHFEENEDPELGNGLIKRVNFTLSNLRREIDRADLVFFSYCYEGTELANKLKTKKNNVFLSSDTSHQLESYRKFGLDALSSAGIPSAPFVEFSNFSDAIDDLIKNPRRVVIKPDGEVLNKSLTYVSSDASDAIYTLRKWSSKPLIGLKKSYAIVLQDFVYGIEMAVGGWIVPGIGFCKYFFENWEFKKFLNDDKGINTGEMGTVGRYTKNSKLANEILKPLEKYLLSIGTVGYVDINCIISSDGKVYPLEFTVRPGWPTFDLQSFLTKNKISSWMIDLLNGKDSLDVNTSIGTVVIVAQPNFPYDNKKSDVGDESPIIGIDAKNIDNVMPCHVKIGEVNFIGKNEPIMVTAGQIIYKAVGYGKTVSDSQIASYKALDRVRVLNNTLYRTDIGNRLSYELPTLQKLGYCTDISYGKKFEYRVDIKEAKS